MKKLCFILMLVIAFSSSGNADNLTDKDATNEITRDECINKANNSDPEHPGKQCSLEISELVKLFMLEEGDKSDSIDFSTGSDVKTKINWKVDSPDCEYGKRCGEVFVTKDGIITHTNLGKTVEPGYWNITLYRDESYRASSVQLSVDSGMGGVNFNLEDLNTGKMNLKLIKKLADTTLNKEILYEINAPGRNKGWLTYTFSSGVSGMVYSEVLTINYSLDKAIKYSSQTVSDVPETENKESTANIKDSSETKEVVPALSKTAAASTSDIDRLTTYSVILGRASACGINTKSESRKVGYWMDSIFPPGSTDQMIYLPLFLQGIQKSAEEQASRNSPDNCAAVTRAFDNMIWP